MHDIIDNREQKLVDHMRAILPSSERARFAVGYFFLSGLEALGDSLRDMKELRLLIGNTSNRRTIEQIAEGYRRLGQAETEAQKLRFAPLSEQRRRTGETARDLCETIAWMDQTDAAQELVRSLADLIASGRLQVRVYTRGRLHSKAYIFDYTQPQPGNDGVAIVGSSNFTLSGLSDNTELNVLVHDNGSTLRAGQGNHARLTQWFNDLWAESEQFDSALMEELDRSWAASLATPYDVYMKTLYALVRERLEGEGETVLMTDDLITRSLADFQKDAVRRAIALIRARGGCFVADVVGLGKSFIGAAVVKHFERAERASALIICPKPLEEMWLRYRAVYELNAEIVPMSLLREGGINLLNDERFARRDFVLIDESHNFRHAANQRYEALEAFLDASPRRVCLLTATPRNSRALDVYHQIKLFHRDDATDLPISPPNLKGYFNEIERGEKPLQDLLSHVLIRRTRRDIVRWYGYDADSKRPLAEMPDAEVAPYLRGEKRAYVMVGGKHQFFPRRRLQTLRYSIEETYNGLYQTLRAYLGKPRGKRAKPKGGELSYARYGLWHYVKKEKQKSETYRELQRAGINLRGLIRTILFKRFESSVHAFRCTLERMIASQTMFLRALQEGIVPAGEEASALLRSNNADEDDLLIQLEAVTGRYKIEDFQAESLQSHIEADLGLLQEMLALVAPITAEQDDKLRTFLQQLEAEPVANRKCLIFTQYADTAHYLYEVLQKKYGAQTEVIAGGDKNKARVVARFAPKANAPLWEKYQNDGEIRLLCATDVLAEGLNMQDCDIVINYDLHWNPVRLIQRFGRIDRIGSEHETIWGLNFLPETGLEKNLGIQEVLKRRIQEIHDTIGEDAAILDTGERLNEGAMYSIYDKAAQPSLFEELEETVDLGQAEELMRSLQRDDGEEWKRISQLRDGIRSGKPSSAGNLVVLCQTGAWRQLFLVDGAGKILSRDVSKILGVLQSERGAPAPDALPLDYNARVMRVLEQFKVEVAHRKTQREHSLTLSDTQKYVQRELRVLFSQTDDAELKPQILLLEQAFCRGSLSGAIKRELGFLKRSGAEGQTLMKNLTDIYYNHQLQNRREEDRARESEDEIPRVICSEALF